MKLSIVDFFKNASNSELIMFEELYNYHLTLNANSGFDIVHLHDRAKKNLKHINVEKRKRGI